MHDIKKYYSYVDHLENELNLWTANEASKEVIWFDNITILPSILRFCLDIYFDSKNENNTQLLNKIKGTLEYAISDIDFLPEAIMGEIGLVDDVYIATLCLNDCIKTLDLKDNIFFRSNMKQVDDIFNTATDVLGPNIFQKCNLYYKNL